MVFIVALGVSHKYSVVEKWGMCVQPPFYDGAWVVFARGIYYLQLKQIHELGRRGYLEEETSQSHKLCTFRVFA